MAAQRKPPALGSNRGQRSSNRSGASLTDWVLQVATDPWLAALIALAPWLKASAQAYATILPGAERRWC